MQKRICKLVKMSPPAITNKGVLFTSCLTANIPVDGTPGYQSGCILQATDGAAGAQLFVNAGTYDSCDFDAIAATEDVTGTLGALTDVGTLAYTNYDILMANGTKYQEVAGSALPLLSATPGTMTASKAVIADANTNVGAVKATSLSIGASGSEVQVTATPAQLNTTTATAGTATASKAVVLDANKAVDVVRTASLRIGASGSEVALTATIAQLNALAAIPVSLGSTTSFVVGTAATPTLIAANATKDRGVLVVVHIDTAFTNVTGNQPTLTIGDDSNATKAFAASTFVSATAGQVFVIGFANTSTNKIVAAWTAGTLTATGAATVTVMALPNS